MIESVRAKQAAYNLITNNCQTYALLLLDAVKATGDAKFPTTLNVYEALTGPGKVMELFPENKQPHEPEQAPTEAVTVAQGVMDQHTTQLDTHMLDEDHDGVPDELEREGEKGEKKGLFKRIFSKNK